jgi:hypothetical protein
VYVFAFVPAAVAVAVAEARRLRSAVFCLVYWAIAGRSAGAWGVQQRTKP